jgi:hypothetical protein
LYEFTLTRDGDGVYLVTLPKAQRLDLNLAIDLASSAPVTGPQLTISNSTATASYELEPEDRDLRKEILNVGYRIRTPDLKKAWKSFDGKIMVTFSPIANGSIRSASLVAWTSKSEFNYNRQHSLPRITSLERR